MPLLHSLPLPPAIKASDESGLAPAVPDRFNRVRPQEHRPSVNFDESFPLLFDLYPVLPSDITVPFPYSLLDLLPPALGAKDQPVTREREHLPDLEGGEELRVSHVRAFVYHELIRLYHGREVLGELGTDEEVRHREGAEGGGDGATGCQTDSQRLGDEGEAVVGVGWMAVLA